MQFITRSTVRHVEHNYRRRICNKCNHAVSTFEYIGHDRSGEEIDDIKRDVAILKKLVASQYLQ